jgi:predicted dehydrogenase
LLAHRLRFRETASDASAKVSESITASRFMRFALLGDHPDGLDLARALTESARHELAIYCGSPLGFEYLARAGLHAQRSGDVEEVLADPAIDAVIVAAGIDSRANQLRRALQSERHVLCVHPADRSADVAYEAAMLQADTGCVLLPLLPEALHPAVQRLAELAQAEPPRLLEFERWSTEDFATEREAALPGWDVLRAVGGEIVEVFALAEAEEMAPSAPVILSGRFADGPLWHATYLPQQATSRWRLALIYPTGRAELEFPDGWPGPARLTHIDSQGEVRTEEWPGRNPWADVASAFEQQLASEGTTLSWQDEQRCLELDDAVRRSIERHRSSTLEFQEATEEATFKGTMTLVGCALLWLSLVLLILAVWVPKLGWVIAPVFAVFLILQGLRWIIPARSPVAPDPDAQPIAHARQTDRVDQHREGIKP